ncbi:general substrate transporter [Dendryphion nanum]|uniref:General substrate transporter n=1 Tax=Dendryphion nanum TaxID=256645 RepID=A0A9P9EKH8_9PLEO|nr:general substrate transporter [Dendryphion nanum]
MADEKTRNDVVHSTSAADIVGANDEAQHAASDEKAMSVFQAIKLYPKAVGWSVVLSSALIMEGYDLALLGSLYGSPQFNRKYGVLNPRTGKYTVPANWQSALSNGARAGEVLGLLFCGFVQEKYGYKKTMLGSLIAMTGFIFILFFAPNIQTLVIGEVFCGIPWGIFQTITTQYASEVSPVKLRPLLTTFVNMCWVMGQFIAAGVNRGCVTRNDQWAYRIPFALQWMWPVPIAIGVLFAPESPWWHIRKGNREAARAALLRLTSPEKDPNFNPDETIAMIEHTNEMEKTMQAGTSYLDCFKGIDLRRTEIVCCTWWAQTLVGTNIMGYFAYFMQKAGLPTIQSFNMSMISLALGLIGTMGSWFLMSHFGRRTIHLSGACALFVILIIVGSMSFGGTQASNWGIGGMLILFVFVYDFTIGPVTYSLVSEIPSTRLKTKTIVMARALYNASNCVVNVLTNYQLSEVNWNWGAKTAYFWAGTCGIVVIWVYFRLPEPRNRTYGELDALFEQRVSARKFATTTVDPYGHGGVSGKDVDMITEKREKQFVEKGNNVSS